MGIIKPEYINEKVTIHDVLPLSFLKLSPYTGSKRGMRYRMERTEREISVPASGTENGIQKDKDADPAAVPAAEPAAETATIKENRLLCSVWFTPFAYDKTDKAAMKTAEFAFTVEGIQEAIDYLNEQLSLLI